MANFQYKGRSSDGRLMDGQIEAVNSDGAANLLLARGITPVSIEERKEALSVTKHINRLLNTRNVETVELIMFCRQMYTISKSGIPLIKGLRGLAVSHRNHNFQAAMNDMIDRLESGSDLSTAMRAHPKIFSSLMVSMVSVGENSGKLEQAFHQLSHYMARDLHTTKSIKTALRYPTIIMIALAIAISIINIKVIPAFAGIFSQFGAELPLPTRILLAVSDFFVHYWFYMLFVVVATWVGISHYIKTPDGSRWWGEKKLTIFVVGDIIERASLARYARSFSLMFSAGLPVTNALELCARSIENNYLADKIRGIRTGIERGEGLHHTHSMSGMFTPLVLQMIAVGEESGQIDVLLTEVADFYEREVEYDIKLLSDRIEPLITVVMAVFVLILALGIFLPMWDMYEIQKK